MTKKELKKAGRPTKRLPEVVSKLEEVFRENATVEQACAYAGIGKATFYRWMEADKDFETKMTSAKYYTTMLSKRNVHNAVKRRDLNTSKWHLEKTEYAPKAVQQNVQVNVKPLLGGEETINVPSYDGDKEDN